ncbi:MAG: hypothetical protein V4722_09690 [Bacteroidota bacterium]
MFGLFGCNNKKRDIVFEKFKARIEKQGLKIDSIDKEGLLHISRGDIDLEISLENVRRNYGRDSDETHISDLADMVVSYSAELPDWPAAKNDVYINLYPNDDGFDFKEYPHAWITEEFSKVYVHSGNDKLTWVTMDDIKKWNVTEAELDKQACQNANVLLDKSPISFDTIANRKLGMINAAHESLKGALLFAPNMKDKVSRDFGFPFYAVIPVRDFCYIFSEKDFGFFSERLRKTVVQEYKESGYPISTEILKFTNKGVEAVGKYPIE